MIITCPNCNKQFKIDHSKIPGKGRNLQCGSCNHVWFFRIQDERSTTSTLNEDLSGNEEEINKFEKNIEVSIKNKQSPSNKLEEKKKKVEKNIEKPKSLIKKNKENTDSKFFSNIVVVIVSFVALIILFDTLKAPLVNIFPGLEIILFNLFETLKDIKLFIIDLT